MHVIKMATTVSEANDLDGTRAEHRGARVYRLLVVSVLSACRRGEAMLHRVL